MRRSRRRLVSIRDGDEASLDAVEKMRPRSGPDLGCLSICMTMSGSGTIRER